MTEKLTIAVETTQRATVIVDRDDVRKLICKHLEEKYELSKQGIGEEGLSIDLEWEYDERYHFIVRITKNEVKQADSFS